MIEFRQLSKRYGDRLAVDDLTVTIPSGQVTALLGPNGAGKSTALRLLLGLDRPTAGSALLDGRQYTRLRDPLRHVGAHLDARTFHPRRSGRANLLALARYTGLPAARVDEVIERVGLGEVSRRKAGTYSLGMSQRLGIAAALLGDPATVLLDEPVNGLDADGVRWIRGLLRHWAEEGRTVLLSSHLMSEVALVADRVVVLGRGRLLADQTPDGLTTAGDCYVEAAVADPEDFEKLRAVLPGDRIAIDRLRINGLDAAEAGRVALRAGVVLRELSTHRMSLEEAYLRLVSDEVQFAAVAA